MTDRCRNRSINRSFDQTTDSNSFVKKMISRNAGSSLVTPVAMIAISLSGELVPLILHAVYAHCARIVCGLCVCRSNDLRQQDFGSTDKITPPLFHAKVQEVWFFIR